MYMVHTYIVCTTMRMQNAATGSERECSCMIACTDKSLAEINLLACKPAKLEQYMLYCTYYIVCIPIASRKETTAAAAVSGRRADRLDAGGGSKGIVMSSFVIRPEQFTTLASFFMGGHKKVHAGGHYYPRCYYTTYNAIAETCLPTARCGHHYRCRRRCTTNRWAEWAKASLSLK